MTTFLGMPVHAPRGVGSLHSAEPFPVAARRALADSQLRRNLGSATGTIRARRAAVVGEVPDWEELRAAGEAVKAATMAGLHEHLVRLEERVTARGGTVHWARDAIEANRIVTDLVRATGTDEVVKVKSMATQEIGLNEALAAAGVTAVETDLAELIVQLGHDSPSHILVPAIHRNRAEIREIFLREMPDAPPDLTDHPQALAAAARLHLRRRFLSAKVAISGANFAVAETGTLLVVESEGNGRMCLTLPETLITVMGIEKLVPTWADLEVFLQLLPRSSTGERMNPYTSAWTGVTPGDGPQEFHLVLLDNGRTATLADPVGRQALHCIRCSACLNVCPVYERTGGHAYGSVYPGPIGAVLTPQLTGISERPSLPYASSLCGACFDACPVRIDIPSLLVHLRAAHTEEVARRRRTPTAEAAGMSLASWVMSDPRRFARAEQAMRAARLLAGRKGRLTALPPPLSGWTTSRDAPAPPKETFREWWARTRGPATATPGPRRDPGVDQPRPAGAGPAPHTAGASPTSHTAGASPASHTGETGPAPRPRATGAGGTAREEVLARIRAATRDARPAPVPRAYRRAGGHPSGAEPLLDLLADRLTDYRATVYRTTAEELPATVRTVLGEVVGDARVVVPPGLPSGWVETGLTDDGGLAASDLDDVAAVVTGCAAACAETGTIVLDGSPDQGRRAITLVPDVHVCVVRADQVVQTVPELLARLDPVRPLTFVSGPSATSDIELDRVEGVHGPRRLHVVLVAG